MFLDNYYEAIVDFSKAIEIDPKDSYLYFWRGCAYKSLKEYPNAIKDLRISQKLDPDFGLSTTILNQIENKGSISWITKNFKKMMISRNSEIAHF